KMAPVRDAWDTNLRIEPQSWGQPGPYYLVRCAGPDKQFQTVDDMAAYLEFHRRKVVAQPSSGANTIDVNIEHDRGAFNGRAEIHGTAVDQWGGALEGAILKVREVSKGKTRTTRANAGGRFSLAGLAPGDYTVEVATKSETVSSKLTLEPRDRANLAAFLRHEPAADVVTVMNEFTRGMALGAVAFEDREFAFRKDEAPPVRQAPPRLKAPASVADTVEATKSALQVENSATLTRTESPSPH